MAGAFSVIAGLAAGAATVRSAFSTMLERPGTVTVTCWSLPLRTVPEPPYRVRKFMSADSVSSWTFLGLVPLLEATRYSYGRSVAMREVAYTEPSANRSIWVPSRSAGWALVSFESAATER